MEQLWCHQGVIIICLLGFKVCSPCLITRTFLHLQIFIIWDTQASGQLKLSEHLRVLNNLDQRRNVTKPRHHFMYKVYLQHELLLLFHEDFTLCDVPLIYSNFLWSSANIPSVVIYLGLFWLSSKYICVHRHLIYFTCYFAIIFIAMENPPWDRKRHCRTWLPQNYQVK